MQLIQDLRAEGLLHPVGVRPDSDKMTRMFAATATIESGRVTIREVAPWLEAFRREILQFPHAPYNDQVDSLSQFLGWATARLYAGPRVRRL